MTVNGHVRFGGRPTEKVPHGSLAGGRSHWQPVFNVLEDGRTVVLVNPQHMKAVPGRKTDVKDSEWLATLLRHGLLRASFIPPAPIRALRELARYRKPLKTERAQEVNRLQKVLESANIKLAMVVTDGLGVSARRMIEALVRDEYDPTTLTDLAYGRLQTKLPELRLALEGRLHAHHRTLIRQMLGHLTFLEDSIATVRQEMEAYLQPVDEAVTLLQTIPGVGAIAAATIVAEIGTDMDRFPSAKHLASRAGVCPGNNESGGKRLGSKPRHGNRWLKAVLGEVAWSITRTRDNYLAAQYQRIARRRGKYRAARAVAHSVLVIAYHILRDKRPYNDLGVDYFDRLDQARLERHHVNRLKQLGYEVTLTPARTARVGITRGDFRRKPVGKLSLGQIPGGTQQRAAHLRADAPRAGLA